MNAPSRPPETIWIYHERQKALLCGQHALNNLAQVPLFSVAQLSDIAQQLDRLEASVMGPSEAMQPSANVDEAGNFSIQVLKAALQDTLQVSLPHLSVVRNNKDVTDFQGFLCHKSDHWFGIRQFGGRFWNLNSMLERPTTVSHFQIGTEMEKWQKEGYTIFAIESGLPEGGDKIEGAGDGNWHLMSDLLQGRSTHADPWSGLSGRGLRLDGWGPAEDDLQRAIRLSLQEAAPMSAVPEEPPVSAPGVVRIQVKLPDGKRLVRRFNATDLVQSIYAVVKQQCPRAFELKYGFPPKDLTELQLKTIQDANLANESIQGRYL